MITGLEHVEEPIPTASGTKEELEISQKELKRAAQVEEGGACLGQIAGQVAQQLAIQCKRDRALSKPGDP